ncbi:EAL domain-containing protein [Massilia niabensis]|uniref:EAL domain-containing protein n=1 Tax=Massilia niabensis TaxID=544910 RepID=A0ABW0KZF9_9BURK
MTTLSPILESVLHEFPGIAYRCLNDPCWTVQYISSGVTALTGYMPEVFTGHQPFTYSDIILVDDRERVQQEIKHALNAGTGFVLTYRIVTAHGKIKFVNEHGNAIRDGDGRIVALQGFVTDVTAARQMQQALNEVTQRFKWIAQATNDNTWDWNLQTNEIWHGDDVRGMFDCPSDTTSRESDCWSTRIHPEDRERVLASMKAAIGSTAGDWSAEYRFQRKDGSYAELLNRAVIIRDPHHAAIRMVGGISDLTERKQSRLHLERLDRALRILNQCSQRLVRADDEHGLLKDICELAVEVGGYQAASVSVVSDARWPLQDGASHGAHFQRLIYPDIPLGADESGDSLAAAAMSSNEQVVCSDIANAPLTAGLREELLGRGYRSAIWLPITHGGQGIGVMTIYCSAVAPFDAEEIQLLRTLADNIAFGIVNIRSREDRKRIELAAVKIVAGVSANTGEAFFEHLARNMALAVGADGAFVARFRDDALQSVHTITAVLDNAALPNFDYEIAGSPCEKLVTSPGCVVLDDVAGCFPASGAVRMGMRGYAGCRLDSMTGQPLGLLFVLFREPVAQPDFVTRIIQIFAARAGAELERQLSDARILEQASLLDKAKDAIVVHDASNRVTYWNKGAERLYGLAADKVLGIPVIEAVYGDAERYQAISTSLAAHGEWQGEIIRRREDGGELALDINSTLVRDTAGQPSSVLSIITDVTRRKAAEHEVAKLAFYDRLTGLPNRHFLEKQLQDFLDGGAATGNEGALLWIGLDRLKSLNDTRGHGIGDLLLQQTSERITASIGAGDVAARFGGDEFVVLIKGLGHAPGKAIAVARALLQRLNEPFDLDGYTHGCSASIGLAYFRSDKDAATEIFKRADIAMYEAKAAGRNTLRLFDTRMQKCAESRAELESDLRRALERDGLHLAYQPQVSEAGHVTGVEALLRWNHPTRGPVSPAEFIPIAETSGLIIPCGEWVLDQACRQLSRWETNALTRSLSIAVNVSAHQLRHPGFVHQVKNVLHHTGADPRKLKLELTESCLVTDTDATVEKMKALKAIGISFSLDDFGTGFSSLSYLKRLPLDQLKIDRSFVSDVTKDANAAVITRSIIALGQSLSLEVIAEGVETECQHRFLAMHGCGIYQGYLFSRPVSVEGVEEYLLHRSERSAALA